MTADPWVPFYPSDWLAGTRHLSASETGVYITLIAMLYERGGELPDDETRLARLCNMPKPSFSKAFSALVDEGKFERKGGQISNNRVSRELKKRSDFRVSQTEKINKRWGKKDNEINDPSLPGNKFGNTETIPTTTTTTTTEDKRGSPDLDSVVSDWNAVARECDLPSVRSLTDTRRRKLRKRLDEIGGDGWRECLAKIRGSPFLRGASGWKVSFDWMLNPANLTKVMEGNYDDGADDYANHVSEIPYSEWTDEQKGMVSKCLNAGQTPAAWKLTPNQVNGLREDGLLAT
tara:strand:+ start:1834 stop:2703 length:870 start_codon:yes stop_codon:yes gene_type:complete